MMLVWKEQLRAGRETLAEHRKLEKNFLEPAQDDMICQVWQGGPGIGVLIGSMVGSHPLPMLGERQNKGKLLGVSHGLSYVRWWGW